MQSLEQMARSHRGHTLGCAAHGLCDCGHGWSGAQGYPTLAGSTAVQSSWDLDPPLHIMIPSSFAQNQGDEGPRKAKWATCWCLKWFTWIAGCLDSRMGPWSHLVVRPAAAAHPALRPRVFLRLPPGEVCSEASCHLESRDTERCLGRSRSSSPKFS